jgi:hypothetical protein
MGVTTVSLLSHNYDNDVEGETGSKRIFPISQIFASIKKV